MRYKAVAIGSIIFSIFVLGFHFEGQYQNASPTLVWANRFVTALIIVIALGIGAYSISKAKKLG